MTDLSSNRPEQAGTGALPLSPTERIRLILGSMPARAAVIAVKLMIVYVLSQTDAAFFYQQF